jgi:hypothetical protein
MSPAPQGTTATARTGCALAVVSALAPWLGGCDDDVVIEYAVGVGTAVGTIPDFIVTVDGAEIDPSETYIRAEYPDFETAITSPLYRIETWRDGELVEAIDIGFGACAFECAIDGDEHCVGEDTILEHVGVDIDEGGCFVGGVLPNPRQWRGGGCMECRFHSGGSGIWCA